METERGLAKRPDLIVVFEECHSGNIIEIDELVEEELILFGTLPHALSDTDKSCLVIAKHRGMLLLSDDERLSKEAERYGVSTAGTVEILEAAIARSELKGKGIKEIIEDLEGKASFKLPRKLGI
jgi:predicted nucleic acid-binding protein